GAVVRRRAEGRPRRGRGDAGRRARSRRLFARGEVLMRPLVIIAFAACSFPEKHPGTGDGGAGDSHGADTLAGDARADGAGGPFGCVGQPFPTNAPGLLT